MAIDKALYAAPQGIDQLGEEGDEPALEISIEDPESVDISGPGFEMHMEKMMSQMTLMIT